jgi:hypothetical protein
LLLSLEEFQREFQRVIAGKDLLVPQPALLVGLAAEWRGPVQLVGDAGVAYPPALVPKFGEQEPARRLEHDGVANHRLQCDRAQRLALKDQLGGVALLLAGARAQLLPTRIQDLLQGARLGNRSRSARGAHAVEQRDASRVGGHVAKLPVEGELYGDAADALPDFIDQSQFEESILALALGRGRLKLVRRLFAALAQRLFGPEGHHDASLPECVSQSRCEVVGERAPVE